ncbi:MAG: hypothetical protein M3Y08_17335 [Fibrobacterota bacterium]|nr:hypothetical protein [Fibrobacterota bacterium]
MALLEARFIVRLNASKVAFLAFFGFSRAGIPEGEPEKKIKHSGIISERLILVDRYLALK